MGGFVVGYDGSDCAKVALARAIEIAKELDEELVVTFGYEPGGYGEEHSEHRRAIEEVGARLTSEALSLINGAGVRGEVSLKPERPVEALLSEADSRDARAIIVGTYGESPIKGAILGSTPHKLLHLSARPVLVVPDPR
jgi:nucleotide-binding universal stress UspA family protein